jgi:4-hydroxybutyrate CoA-transferase
MKIVKKVEWAVNSSTLPPGSIIYIAGNAATPQVLLRQLASDTSIRDVETLSLLLLGDIAELFSKESCERINHRIIFNGPHSREAMNKGWTRYQLIHLSDIPNQLLKYIRPNVVLLTVAGPDNGGNYSLGTTVEGVRAAIDSARASKGLVIAERNVNMPFVLGTTVHYSEIDYLIETNYELPHTPVHTMDERASRIGDLIAELYINDGCTLQYGIGEVPEAVTQAIINKGVKDLGIWTELFADAMRGLVDKGIVTNKYLSHGFSVSSIFLANSKEGYQWLDFNSSVQSRPSNRTNSAMLIAQQPRMISINSAIGADLHGNIWADSMNAREIYGGIGGQVDFIRGSYQSEGGIPIIAMKSTTDKGQSKIMDMCPQGITTTAIPADPVVIVTENGAFDPRGLTIAEHAVGIAHLAADEYKEQLLREIYDSNVFHKPQEALKEVHRKGFISYDDVFGNK